METTDTWGISGPAFLTLYGIAYLLVAALVLLGRRAENRRADSGSTMSLRMWHPCDVALLSGIDLATGVGIMRLVQIDCLRVDAPYDEALADSTKTALRKLTRATRRQLAVDVREAQGSARIELHASPPADAHPVELAILEAAADRNGGVDTLTVRERVAAAPQVRDALMEATDRIATPRDLLRARRLLALAWLPLFAAGVVRFIAGVDNHKPVDFLFIALTATVAAAWLTASPPKRQTALTRAVARERREPRWVVHDGPLTADAVMATALFGSSVFWTVHPGVAASIGLPPPFSAGWAGIASTGVDASASSGGGDGGSGGGCGG